MLTGFLFCTYSTLDYLGEGINDISVGEARFSEALTCAFCWYSERETPTNSHDSFFSLALSRNLELGVLFLK